MIKNLVFDFGKVLVHFEPLYMAGRYAESEEDARILAEVVFDRLYWDRLDAGTIEDGEVISLVKERLPARLRQTAESAYCNWIYNIPEIDGMADLLRWIKSEYGIPVYLLSNISKYFAHHSEEIPILRLLDRCFFSSEIGLLKPSENIYAHVCSECGIDAKSTLFIDDSPKNIEGARRFGMAGYLFDGDAEKLKKYIEANLMIEK